MHYEHVRGRPPRVKTSLASASFSCDWAEEAKDITPHSTALHLHSSELSARGILTPDNSSSLKLRLAPRLVTELMHSLNCQLRYEKQLGETTIRNFLSHNSRICVPRVAICPMASDRLCFTCLGCGLSMQGEKDTNAGKGVTWCFSSTLQLVHVSTGKVIGAAVLLSEWLSLYVSTLAVDHCSEEILGRRRRSVW